MSPLLMFAIFININSILCAISYYDSTAMNLNKCGKVYITISSYPSNNIELNWINNCYETNDVIVNIGLYDANPLEHLNLNPLVLVRAEDNSDGYTRTNIEFDLSSYHVEATITKFRFPFWIASIGTNGFIDVESFTTNPSWMIDSSATLGFRRLGDVFLPGTHDSAAYNVPIIVRKFTATQDTTILQQLIFGVRYLDLRVGFHRQDYYIYHNFVRIQKLRPILKEIASFLRVFTKEIVIVDFHQFTHPSKFTVLMHENLLTLIMEELGEFAFSRKGFEGINTPTLNEIWNANKNVIIGYADSDFLTRNDLLWVQTSHRWGNKIKHEELITYIDSVVEGKRPDQQLWSLMTELTPRPATILICQDGLRELAQRVNTKISKLFRERWWKNVNIVATDFFLGNDIINVAIQANLLKPY